jgi:hypothetical protein
MCLSSCIMGVQIRSQCCWFQGLEGVAPAPALALLNTARACACVGDIMHCLTHVLPALSAVVHACALPAPLNGARHPRTAALPAAAAAHEVGFCSCSSGLCFTLGAHLM